jgi:hypothetical protein
LKSGYIFSTISRLLDVLTRSNLSFFLGLHNHTAAAFLKKRIEEFFERILLAEANFKDRILQTPLSFAEDNACSRSGSAPN